METIIKDRNFFFTFQRLKEINYRLGKVDSLAEVLVLVIESPDCMMPAQISNILQERDFYIYVPDGGIWKDAIFAVFPEVI